MQTAPLSLWQSWRSRGDERAFEGLVRPYLAFAVDLARRSGCSAADAEDVLQDALVRLAREEGDGPMVVGVKAWIGRVVSLRSRMLRRGEARRRRRERSSARPDAPCDGAGMEIDQTVDHALAALPELEREAVVLHYVHDVDYAEMGRILDVSPNACRIRVHRGIERLRRRFGERAPALVAALPLFPLPERSSALVHAALQKAALSSYVLAGLGGALVMKKLLVMAAVAAVVGTATYFVWRSTSGRESVPESPDAVSAARDEEPAGLHGIPPAEAPASPGVAEPSVPRATASTSRAALVARIWKSGGLVGVETKDDSGKTSIYYQVKASPEAAELVASQKVVHVKAGKTGAGAWLADLDAFPDLQVLIFSEHTEPLDLTRLPVLPNLTQVELDRAVVDAAGIGSLVHQRALTSLDLGHQRLDSDALRAVATLRGLESLRLEETKLDDAGIQAIAALPRLAWLKLDEAEVSDAGLASLAGTASLQYLDLSDTRVTGEGFRHLAGLGALRRLTLEKSRVDDEGLRHAAALPVLVQIDLEGTDVTDAGVLHLAESRTLEDVNLEKTRVTDAVFDVLARISTLKRLNVGDTRVTQEGIARFRVARPDVRVRD